MPSQSRPARFPTEAHLEHGRRAAECAYVGLVWALFSLPVVTAGAAWLAAVTIFDAWTRHEEPPVLRTFAHVVPRQFGAGLLGTVTAACIVALTDLDVRFALAAHVPAAPVEAALLTLLGAAALAVLLLVADARARTSAGARECTRAVLVRCRDTPWVLPLVIVALWVTVVLAALVPALVLVLAGPLGFAVSAVATRAAAS